MKAIDTFVNVNMGSDERPPFLIRVAEDYFRKGESMFKDYSIAELLDIMDRNNVEKCIISANAHALIPRITEFVEKRPDRFTLSVWLDPHTGMKGVRDLESAVRNFPVSLARVVPFMVNLAPNDKAYYPIYAKCIELDLPISCNTGIPGPPMPGEVQNPMYLDEVCLFFPELKICMAHGADPWWGVAIRLMIKYKNLYMKTSAYAPKYFPPELINFMNTRGQDKIIFASDHPVLTIERCVQEARQLVLREGVMEKFLYTNAQKLFWGHLKPESSVQSPKFQARTY